MHVVWISRLLSKTKQSAINHSNAHGFRDAGMVNVAKSPLAFCQLPEVIYPSLVSQEFGLGWKSRRVWFTVHTCMITWKLMFFEGNGSWHVFVRIPKSWRKLNNMNEWGSRLCPTVPYCLLRVEEFSLDKGLPNAVDVIDTNHVSLTSWRTIFLDFDYC